MCIATGTALLIASLIGAGTGIGTTVAGALDKPGDSAKDQLKAQTPGAVSQLTQDRAAETAQAQQLLPGLQYSGSGGLSPGYLSQESADLSGNASLNGTSGLNAAIAQFLGMPSGGSSISGGSGTGANMSALPGVSPGLSLNGNPNMSGLAQNFLSGTGGSNTPQNPFATSVFGLS